MEDVFKPQSLSIKKFLSDSDSLYQIPRYQRPYSWGDDQLEKLWDDLIEAYDTTSNYFLGSVITAKPDGGGSYLDIVDGQQRLTTLQILMCVYRDLYPTINADLFEDADAVDINIIKASIKYNDKLQRLRLKTHSNHESDFNDLIIKEGQSIKNKRPLKKEIRIGEEPKYKFINTAVFFHNKLEELGQEDSGLFINYLFNQVKIIRIDCQSVSFAIKLFQVLNDRGLDLSNSDLIKSILIGKIQKLYMNDPEHKKLKEDQFMDDWKNCENIAIDTDESINDLFVLYEYYLLAENPKKSLYDELVKQFESKDPNEVLADFKKFIKLYKEKVFYREDDLMYGFWYLRWSMYWRAIVLTALKVDYPDYESFLVEFRRFYYLNWIAGNTLTKIKQISFNLIGWLKEKKSLSFIKKQFEEHMESRGVYTDAINSLDGEIYFEPWCKPLYFLIEYNQLDSPSFLPIGEKTIQIEHILPRSYSKSDDWNQFNEIENIELWVNSGANLTLLSGSKNIAASNNSFQAKMKAYDGTGYHTKIDKKITAFRITQKIVNDFNSNKFNKEWNSDSLNDRWTWFCSQVGHILRIDIEELKESSL